MSAHTPGPWHLVLSNNATPFVMHEHGDDWTDIHDLASIICIMPAEITRSYNSFANARLIAAAPELLQVLKDIEAMLNAGLDASIVMDENSPMRDAMRDAIRKAEGGAA